MAAGEVSMTNPNGQLMITYRCSAACRHCLVMAEPEQERTVMSVEDAVRWGLEYAKLGRHVMIAGGEALLFYKQVLAMCAALKARGVPVAFIESNGSWCRSDELTKRRLTRLREAGVEGMYFSVDPYHQEFVPAERVCRGSRIAKELFGEDQVYAPNPTLEEAGDLEIVAGDPERLREYARSRRVSFIGRAADALTGFADPVPLAGLLEQDCRKDLDVDHLREIQVDPFGFVRPDMCPGVNLGNANQQPLAELGCTQRVCEVLLLRELAERGPASLLPLAEPAGFKPRSTYASKCHLCFEIRRHLVRRMPDELGPPHAYALVRG
ncbi:MAG: radical SAM protein [Armatimonadetes bacterium]|nr:radical SAM protein [Armatimonadota bacterium]NCP29740.1 radical SAM protein [Armatimonadota bacterium]NCQ29072.1 radical SAM protein [Armatimonadota bacterium]NDK15428.1 radical SAM protein [Armatimonadota bacterium]